MSDSTMSLRDYRRERELLLNRMLLAVKEHDDDTYADAYDQLIDLEKEAGEYDDWSDPETVELRIPAADTGIRLSSPCDRTEVVGFTTQWLTVADLDRELRARQAGDSEQENRRSPAEMLGMAAMYLGRAVYYVTIGDARETQMAILKTAGLLFEAWRRLR